MSSMSSNYFRSVAAELRSKFGRVNNFTSHTGSIGTYHEQALRSVLKQILPARFSLRTGFVYFSEEKVSKQMDILIIDENEPSSYFLQDGDFVIVHPDAVVAAIEVKTKLNSNELKFASENIATFIDVCSNKSDRDHKFAPAFIFAYSAPTFTPDRLGKYFLKCPKLDFNQHPFCIFVENNYFLQLLGGKKNLPLGLYPIRMFDITKEEENLLHISLFLANIRKVCEMHDGKKSNPFNYSLISNFGGITVGKQYFKFGEDYKTY